MRQWLPSSLIHRLRCQSASIVPMYMSCDIMWHHMMSCDIMWHHKHHVTSHDIMWHHKRHRYQLPCAMLRNAITVLRLMHTLPCLVVRAIWILSWVLDCFAGCSHYVTAQEVLCVIGTIVSHFQRNSWALILCWISSQTVARLFIFQLVTPQVL